MILDNLLTLDFRSTSKLRKEPGVDKRCFRCGTNHHKTLQCPNDPGNNSLKRTSSMGNIPSADIADPKRFAADVKFSIFCFVSSPLAILHLFQYFFVDFYFLFKKIGQLVKYFVTF